ncbi:carbohydrate-binding module family 43 protein [Oidiodendron maius Zn]|uniref:1,3-beta-glucanosyltransferase n=1 Tax=Oidiodendron maius (strain Zn) TaxID=913774 RepID=A0A0C3H4N7_OIDMZ|nr:carbohydrate-binding module family 43 protein [Oidiodendron maius Zn]
MRVSTLLAAAASLATTVLADVDPIVIKGSHFFYKTNGSEYFVQGVAYQYPAADLANADPLAVPAGCTRDIPHLLAVRTNLISVYSVNPELDHSACMTALADAGIYVLLDLANTTYSINRADPAWSTSLYDHYTAVIDEFQSYNNILGFVVGNEVANSANTSTADAFVKAAVRDMKSYIAEKKYRAIPVGYAADDDADIRYQVAEYFDCGDASSAIDFYGLNNYEWCGDSSFAGSGYQARTSEFSSWNIPVFLSEYGCNTVEPRVFTEVQAIFGSDMTGVWSGGVVFEYFQDTNNYGLVSLEGSSVSLMTDYTSYSAQMAKITPSSTNSASYKVTNTAAAACPTTNSTWNVSPNLPPTPNDQVCSCMASSVQCAASPSLSDEDVGKLLGVVCGLSASACSGISADGATGVYGIYSPCDASAQLNYALNAYYLQQSSKGNGASACAFSGSATLQAATTAASCKSVLSSASSAAATATGGSSSGGSASSSTSKAAAAGGLVYHTIGVSNGFQAGLYMFVALTTGVLMIVL